MARINTIYTNGRELVKDVLPQFVEHTIVESIGSNFEVVEIDEHTALAYCEGLGGIPNMKVLQQFGIRANGPAVTIDLDVAKELLSR
jgi:hypothetical protein